MTFIHQSPALRGPAESHSPALHNSNFYGGIFAYYHKPGTVGEFQRSLRHTSAPLSLMGDVWGAVVTNDWLVHYRTDNRLIFRLWLASPSLNQDYPGGLLCWIHYYEKCFRHTALHVNTPFVEQRNFRNIHQILTFFVLRYLAQYRYCLPLDFFFFQII